jgi:hypothetical protein
VPLPGGERQEDVKHRRSQGPIGFLAWHSSRI